MVSLNAMTSRAVFFFSYMVLLTFIFSVGYYYQFNFNEVSSNFIAKLFVLKGFIFESFVVILFLVILNQKPVYLRILSYAILAAYVFINTTQLLAVWQGGEYLSRLAVENINHISLLINYKTIGVISLSAIVFIFPVAICEKLLKKKTSFKAVIVIVFGVLLSAVSVEQFKKRIDWKTKQEIDRIRGELNLAVSSPIMSFVQVLGPAKPHLEKLPNVDPNVMSQLGIFYNPNQDYPLVKPNITSQPAPFKINAKHKNKKPNIIILFTEGFAARTTNVYSNSFKNITPNILEFSKQAMVVQNYYSHTAATYRGLHGQLCSLFPKYGGRGGWHTNYSDIPKTNYLCLNNVLENNGYETTFIDTHRKDSAYIDELMSTHIGFENVLTAEELSDLYLKNEEPNRSDSLDDQQLYQTLIGYLKDHEETSTPFLVGMYNLETHAFQDTAANAIKYQGGSNNALNTIHNLDNAFGKFWRYFKSSPLFNNTIVILTSDHTHFTEKSYVEAVLKSGQLDYQREFIDRIPLIIFDASRQIPSVYDARYSSSISLTPSLLHYLGYQDTPNSFIGNSIFDNNRTVEASLASYGKEDYLIIKGGIFSDKKISDLSEENKIIFNNARSFIYQSKSLEINNKIWKE